MTKEQWIERANKVSDFVQKDKIVYNETGISFFEGGYLGELMDGYCELLVFHLVDSDNEYIEEYLDMFWDIAYDGYTHIHENGTLCSIETWSDYYDTVLKLIKEEGEENE